MRPFFSFLAIVLLVAMCGGVAKAGLIAQNLSTSGLGTDYFGQSFQTPVGGPWADLTLNFYSDAATTTPFAAGIAYVFASEYSGIPAALSSASFLFSSTSISQGT